MKDLPLILIHGYPFDHTLWYSVIASLGSNAKVLAPDLPGFGRTGAPPEQEPSLELYADFILHFIERHGFSEAIVGGMSMGGYVALAFAEKYRERVAGLALISAQAAADTEEGRQNRRNLMGKIRKEGVSAAIGAILPKMFSTARTLSNDLRSFVVEGAERAGVEGLCWALEAMARRPSRTELVSSLEVPVLVAHGREDAIIPIAKARALAETCKLPQFAELRSAGHATPLEAPDDLAQALARLADSVRTHRATETGAQKV